MRRERCGRHRKSIWLLINMSPTDLPQPKRRIMTTRQWRINAARLLVFLILLTIESAFNVGILLGRLRWKNDRVWLQQVFFIMCGMLAVLLWALYQQTRRVLREFVNDADTSGQE